MFCREGRERLRISFSYMVYDRVVDRRPNRAALQERSSAWYVPDRRRPGAFLNRDGERLPGWDARPKGVPGGPSTCRVLQHPHLIKSTLLRLECRIAPHGFELTISYILTETAIIEIDPGSIVRTTMRLGVDR